MRGGFRRWALGLGVIALVGSVGATAPALAVSQQQSVPMSTGQGFLNGVAAVSANNVWAVGGTVGVNSRTLVDHWNGTAWSRVASPNRGLFDSLEGVDAVSPSNVWAVGSYTFGGKIRTLTEHWNGATWVRIVSPNPVGADESELSGVTAISATNVWAVGETASSSTPRATLVEHWDGHTWTRVASWNPGGGHNGSLSGVDAVTATNVWAVGRYGNSTAEGSNTLVEHWNGSTWNHVTSANPSAPRRAKGLWSVDALTASNIWAVGYYATPTRSSLTLVEHWNGHTWTRIASPNPIGQFDSLNSVSIRSASDVWAVGSTTNGTLIEHWNGHLWQRVASPTAAGSLLSGVGGVADNDVWAVGFDNTGHSTDSVIQHWNGSSWSQK